MPPPNTLNRFWTNVNKDGHTHPTYGQCWVWIGCKTPKGYGLFKLGTEITTHRVSWTVHNGRIPDGLCVLHRCDNTSCVNPKHLFLGTQLDNIADMVSKSRQAKGVKHKSKTKPETVAKGESHGRARLTNESIHEIRRLSRQGATQAKIALFFGVTQKTISKIINHKQWKHI